MKKKILAACVAALSLAAGGCTEGETKRSKGTTHGAGAVVQAPPRVTTATPGSAIGVRDAGFDGSAAALTLALSEGERETPRLDVVGLAHEDTRLVDHLARAVMLRTEGDLEGAMAEARRAVFDSPEDVDALTQVDRIAKLQGQHNLRVAALERLAAIQKDDATPLIQQARVLIAMKDYEGAIKVAQDATMRDASNPESFHAMGRAYMNLGQLAPAIESFRKVLSLNPDHGYALNNLGFALLRANENEEALTVLERAVEVLPHLAYVHNNLGVALERMGRKDEAKDAYAQASYLSPKYVKARVNASRVASVSGDVLEGQPEILSDENTPSELPVEPTSEE